MDNFRKTSASSSLLELKNAIFSVSEVAALLGKSEDTITRWCKSGRIVATQARYGSKTSFQIPRNALQLFTEQLEEEKQIKQAKNKQNSSSSVAEKDLLEKFGKVCHQGIIGRKAFSDRTVTAYVDHLKRFYQDFDKLSYHTVKDRLIAIPKEQFATREKLHRAVVCFAKFLEIEGLADKTLVTSLKPLKPKRDREPERKTVSEDDLRKMLEACGDNIEDRFIVMMLAHTGLRATEYGALKRSDLDLKARKISVQKGKGGKKRVVGITNELLTTIKDYLSAHPRSADEYLHPNDKGQQMNKDGVYQRITRIGDKAGVKAASHALRRAFVTINANKGRSMVMLQMACGHSTITLTRDYCRTSEQEVVEAMQNW